MFWDSEYLDLPIVEKRNQKRPAFDSETVTELVGSAKRYVQMVYVLAATSGMRIGEVLGHNAVYLLDRCASTAMQRDAVEALHMCASGITLHCLTRGDYYDLAGKQPPSCAVSSVVLNL